MCRRSHDDTVSLASTDSWAAVLHGRVDNQAELAKDLPATPRQRAEPSTAELALAAFRAWGASSVDRFRGAFAGVVTNGVSTWAFRDHLGSRPLFYRRTSDRLVFATEAKMVAAAADLSRRPNLDAIEDLFYRGISSRAAIESVERLLNGSIATATGSSFTTSTYWDPSALLETSDLDADAASEVFAELLDRVVTRQVTGRDAVALSGGLDSPTVAALAAPAHREMSGIPLEAYTAVFPSHPSTDESFYTAMVAEYLGIKLQTYEQRAGPLDDLPGWVDLADGPWDSLPASMASEGYQVARSLGASTVMTGDLAEYLLTIRDGFLGHLLLQGRFRALRDQVVARRRIGRSRRGVARQLGRDIIPGSLGAVYSQWTRRYNRRIPDWILPEARGGTRLRTDLSSPVGKRWSDSQLLVTRGASSTMEADEIFADRLGVTVRRPFGDRDLWEFVLSLRAEVKNPSPLPKSLLREAMRGRLPDAILSRTDKTVFDEHMIDTAQYAELERWIDDRNYRMPGVDYAVLRDHLERRDLAPGHLVWAYDLARVHAFVGLFT
jgi:asparagine synthase (glutamine-hydrolysing)